MTKQEFEKISGKTVSQGDYANIEFVYQFHPSIPNVGGKEMIAELYNLGGMRLILDMKRTADEAKWIETVMANLRRRLDTLEARYKALKEGKAFNEEDC